MTVINGRNGSGKSAVVAALQVSAEAAALRGVHNSTSRQYTRLLPVQMGLGLQAGKVDRADRAVEMIRKGSNADAKIIIRLRQTEEGYLPLKLGKVVRVERTIRATGASVYRLYNDSSGALVAEGRKPLIALVRQLDIQVCCSFLLLLLRLLFMALGLTPTRQNLWCCPPNSLSCQVDNPLCICTQEEVKKFVNGSPEDKYKVSIGRERERPHTFASRR